MGSRLTKLAEVFVYVRHGGSHYCVELVHVSLFRSAGRYAPSSFIHSKGGQVGQPCDDMHLPWHLFNLVHVFGLYVIEFAAKFAKWLSEGRRAVLASA